MQGLHSGAPSTIVELNAGWTARSCARGDRLRARANISRVTRPTAVRPTSSPLHERAVLVGLISGAARRFDPEHSLDELAGLAARRRRQRGCACCRNANRPTRRRSLAAGSSSDLRPRGGARADMVIFDNERPAQLRNIEAALDRKVIDRTQPSSTPRGARDLGRKPRSSRAAALPDAAPGRTSAALSRLGGDRHARPGRNQARTDRRRIRHRVSMVSKEIDAVRRRRAQSRERRQRRLCRRCILVGYTKPARPPLQCPDGWDAVASNALPVTLIRWSAGSSFPTAASSVRHGASSSGSRCWWRRFGPRRELRRRPAGPRIDASNPSRAADGGSPHGARRRRADTVPVLSSHRAIASTMENGAAAGGLSRRRACRR
jgi:hypothetical protein